MTAERGAETQTDVDGDVQVSDISIEDFRRKLVDQDRQRDHNANQRVKNDPGHILIKLIDLDNKAFRDKPDLTPTHFTRELTTAIIYCEKVEQFIVEVRTSRSSKHRLGEDMIDHMRLPRMGKKTYEKVRKAIIELTLRDNSSDE